MLIQTTEVITGINNTIGNTVWINPIHIASVFKHASSQDYIVRTVDHHLFRLDEKHALELIATINGEPPVIESPAPAAPVAPDTPTPADDDPETVTDQIVWMERAETANSKSPMWRCRTANGERVNIFEHDDPEKNNFALFAFSKHLPAMRNMQVGDILSWNTHPLPVAMKKSGKFWEIVGVPAFITTNPTPDAPEQTTGTDDYFAAQKQEAIGLARILTTPDCYSPKNDGSSKKMPVFLDFETTGIGDDARIVQIGIVDSDGNVLMDKLINPEIPIPADATEKHHITDEMVKDAPTFADVVGELIFVHLHDRGEIIAYNSEFEERMIASEWQRAQLKKMPELTFICAMKLYAQYRGDWNSYRHDFKWHTLEDAYAYEVSTSPDDLEPAHSAIGDCKRTRSLVNVIAGAGSSQPAISKKVIAEIPF